MPEQQLSGTIVDVQSITVPDFQRAVMYTVIPEATKVKAKLAGGKNEMQLGRLTRTTEVRCGKCGHKIGEFSRATGEVKCNKCKKLNSIEV